MCQSLNFLEGDFVNLIKCIEYKHSISILSMEFKYDYLNLYYECKILI